MRLANALLLVCVGALLALGMVMLYSSRMGQGGEHLMLTQLGWCGLGMVAAGGALLFDYRRLRGRWTPVLLLMIALVLLALVFVPGVGFKVKGARRWIGLDGLRLQPSEFAKLALVIVLAYYGERHQSKMRRFVRGLVIPGLIIGPVLMLIFLEPDWGTTILLASVSVAMLLLAGVRWWHLAPPILLVGAGLVILLMHNPTRLQRVMAWLDPETHRQGAGYQTWQSIMAFGAGGWDGLGLGNSRQKMGFLPEHQTDFIFPVIGEELGLVATLAVVLAFILLIVCGATIAWNASDTFGFLLAAGLTLIIGLQAFINIGVVTGILPNKGLPLPFISYGGSNLIMSLTVIGLLLNIGRRGGQSQPALTESLSHPEPALVPF